MGFWEWDYSESLDTAALLRRENSDLRDDQNGRGLDAAAKAAK